MVRNYNKMEKERQKRTTKTSRAQYEVYLNCLLGNELFKNNKFGSKNPNLLKKKHWKELTTLLNSAGGPKKDVDSWKRVIYYCGIQ